MARMAQKKKGRKVRVDFRRNRAQTRRSDDWTRDYHNADRRDNLEDARSGETVRAKGDLSRKRTVIVDDNEDPLIDERQWQNGLVVGVHGLICRVEQPGGAAWQCTVRRVLRTLLIQQSTPVTVGDQVWFSDQREHHDGQPVGVIERVAERTTSLSRRDRRGRAQTIVANADQLLIVASVAQPNLKPHLIDRYLIAAGQGDLRPIIVFNKWDLLDEHAAAATETAESNESAVDFGDDSYAGPAMTVTDVIAEFESLGYTCLRTSVVTQRGIGRLCAELCDHRTVLSGQSGVGKSSLLNAIQPGLNLQVAAVSEESEKGRHTTTLARQIRLECGGYVIDTPGVRSFELWNVEPGELEAYFTEFVPRVGLCRFNDCHHTHEEGCAIAAAVESGEISPRRYYSYLKMLEELAAENRP